MMTNIDEDKLVESPYVEYKEGFKYQLNKDLIINTGILGFSIRAENIRLFPNGFMIMFKGFAWDGASGPTVDTKSSMRGSAPHDALYQLVRLGFLPSHYHGQIDKLLTRVGTDDGMWKIRSGVWERMLSYFGRANLRPSRERLILRAP